MEKKLTAKNLEWGLSIKNNNHLIAIEQFLFSFTYIFVISLFI